MIEPVTATLFLKGLFTKKTVVKSIAFGFWIMIFAVIIYFAWLVYSKVMQETESYHQQAKDIVNYEWTLEPHQTFFGCNRFVIQTPKENIKRQGTQIEKTK